MKKSFTLALAAAAALSASAVDFNASLQKIEANAYLGKASNITLERIDDGMSRADDAVTPEGTYQTSMYLLIVQGTQLAGAYMQSAGEIEIVANPAVENGYIIKNFLAGFVFTDDSKTTNDINATWNPTTSELTLEKYPVLFDSKDVNAADNGDIHLIVADANGNWTDRLSLVFNFTSNLLTFAEDTAFMLGELTSEGVYGYPYQFPSFNCAIPNGTFSYTDSQDQENTIDILGVKLADQCFVFNFGDTTFLNRAIFNIRGDAFINLCGTDAENAIPSAFIHVYDPASGTNVQDYLFCCYCNDNMEPVSSTNWFEMAGSIVNSDPTNYEVSFPTFGLFTANDDIEGYYANGVLKFSSALVAGIESIDAEAAATTAPVYYNLQGARVNNPADGIFIRVEGNNATKVIL